MPAAMRLVKIGVGKRLIKLASLALALFRGEPYELELIDEQLRPRGPTINPHSGEKAAGRKRRGLLSHPASG
jgi:hypothetical protein